MFGRHQMLAVAVAGTLSLFTLVSCSSNSRPTVTLPAEVTPTATASDTTAMPASQAVSTGELSAMSVQVAETKAAVEAGNFDTAKIASSKIEDAWKQVEDGIKEKDKTAYDTIETHLDATNRSLKGSSPDAKAVLGHLTELEAAITSVPQ
ncbi:MAG: hypothetical protein WBC73_02960 [Phormidesmis sp.]